MHRVAQVVVRDHRGWLLLQERDEHASTHPNLWGLVGGGVEAGETIHDAAHRELEEETGIRLDDDFAEIARYEVPCGIAGEVDQVGLLFVSTHLTDADVICHEGRQIIFVDPASLSVLDLAPPTAIGIDAFNAWSHD